MRPVWRFVIESDTETKYDPRYFEVKPAVDIRQTVQLKWHIQLNCLSLQISVKVSVKH